MSSSPAPRSTACSTTPTSSRSLDTRIATHPAVATPRPARPEPEPTLILPMATVDPMRRAEGSISDRHLGLDLEGHPPPDPMRRAEGDPVWRSLTLTDPGQSR